MGAAPPPRARNCGVELCTLFACDETPSDRCVHIGDQGGQALATLSLSAEIQFSGLRREAAGHVGHAFGHLIDGLGERSVLAVAPQVSGLRGAFAGTALGGGLRVTGVV